MAQHEGVRSRATSPWGRDSNDGRRRRRTTTCGASGAMDGAPEADDPEQEQPEGPCRSPERAPRTRETGGLRRRGGAGVFRASTPGGVVWRETVRGRLAGCLEDTGGFGSAVATAATAEPGDLDDVAEDLDAACPGPLVRRRRQGRGRGGRWRIDRGLVRVARGRTGDGLPADERSGGPLRAQRCSRSAGWGHGPCAEGGRQGMGEVL